MGRRPTVLLTGSEGSLGTHLVGELELAGYAVRTFDVIASRSGRADHVIGDVRRFPEIISALAGCTAVVHGAVLPLDASVSTPAELLDVNVAGTWTVLGACAELGVRRVVYLSSVNAIGFAVAPRRREALPMSDDWTPEPVVPYELSKHLAEEACRAFAAHHGLCTICLRPVYVARPEEYATFSTARRNSATEYWSYLDIRDLSSAVVAALAADLNGHETCLLAARDTSSEIPTAELWATFYPQVPFPEISAYLEGDPYRSLVSCARAERVLGWRARHSWRDGDVQPSRGATASSAQDVPGSSRIELGPFSFTWTDGRIDDLRHGEIAIARRIYVGVRDRAWATVPPSHVTVPTVDEAASSMRWTAECRGGEAIDFAWGMELETTACALVLRLHGAARHDFLSPRLGLCVLLDPVELDQARYEIDEKTTHTFRDVAARPVRAHDFTRICIHTEATVLELAADRPILGLEDQRPFGDATYKLWGDLGDGSLFRAGDERSLELRIEVSARPSRARPRRRSASPATELVTRRELAYVAPRLVLDVSDPEAHDPQSLADVTASGGALHLDVDVRPRGDRGRFLALAARHRREVTSLSLRHARHASREVERFLGSALAIAASQRLALRHLDASIFIDPRSLRELAKRHGYPRARIGSSIENHWEWECLRVAALEGVDHVAWRGSPLVHQRDDDIVLDNAAAAESLARTLADHIPAPTLGPIALERSGQFESTDYRAARPLMGAFVASLFAAAARGSASRVIVNAPTVTSIGGRREKTAAARVIERIAAWPGTPLFSVTASSREIVGFATQRGRVRQLVVVNTRAEPRRVRLDGRYAAVASSCPELALGQRRRGRSDELVIAGHEVCFLKR